MQIEVEKHGVLLGSAILPDFWIVVSLDWLICLGLVRLSASSRGYLSKLLVPLSCRFFVLFGLYCFSSFLVVSFICLFFRCLVFWSINHYSFYQ